MGRATETLAWGTVTDGGGRVTHRSTAAVDGEAAAGSQDGRVASGNISSSRGVVSCGVLELFSTASAPWHGSMATFLARSVQAKDS
jgi:hypothetical protein